MHFKVEMNRLIILMMFYGRLCMLPPLNGRVWGHELISSSKAVHYGELMHAHWGFFNVKFVNILYDLLVLVILI